MCSIIVRQVYLHYKGHFRLQWRRTPENLGVALVESSSRSCWASGAIGRRPSPDLDRATALATWQVAAGCMAWPQRQLASCSRAAVQAQRRRARRSG